MVSTKHFVKRLNEGNFGTIAGSILALAIVGIIFLAQLGIPSGTIYLASFTGTLAFFVLLLNMRKNEDNPINAIPIPFSKRFNVDFFFYILGFWTPILFTLLLGFVGLFSLVSPFTLVQVPLYTGSIEQFVQSFATASISENIQTKIFTIMYVAGSLESFVYNWLWLIIFGFVGILISKLALNKTKGDTSKKIVLTTAFVGSIAWFLFSHFTNSSYNNIFKFLFAGVFLFIGTFTIIKWGIPLSYWIGYHQSNNLLYLVIILGGATVIKGLFGVFGILFMMLSALMTYYLIKNWSSIWKDMKWYWKQ